MNEEEIWEEEFNYGFNVLYKMKKEQED